MTAIAILALVLFDFEKGDVNDRRGDAASDQGGCPATTHPWQGQGI